MDYQPRPIDTSRVVLGPELIDLTEKLAENAHEVWGLQRVKDGWTVGSKRDDSKKEHPCLVLYDQLPESEKVYDRNASMETLKAILALGFQILPPPDQTGQEPSDSAEASKFLLEAVEEGSTTSPRPSAEACLDLAKRKLASGEPLLAYDIIETGLASDPSNVALRQQQALALARSGDPERAGRILASLVDSGMKDEETLGLLARTIKDLGLGTARTRPGTSTPRTRTFLRDLSRGVSGIGRDLDRGQRRPRWHLFLAKWRRPENSRLRSTPRHWTSCKPAGAEAGDSYWTVATLGETALILGDFPEAERWYSQVSASSWSSRNFGSLASTRRQARLLARHLPGAEGVVARCFQAPRVVVFSGHRIDAPGRSSPRFPMELEEPVRLAIRERLESVGGMIGYGSAATGADLLFLEELLARGGEAHVVLPYEREQFLLDTIDGLADAGWLARLRRVLDQSEVITASPQRLEAGGLSYEFANLIAQGLGSLKAKQLDAELIPMAVWDGLPGDGKGGTAGSIARWRVQGLEIEVIDLAAIARENGFEPSRALEQSGTSDDDRPEATGRGSRRFSSRMWWVSAS